MKDLLRPLELVFRHAFVYPLFRLFFRNAPHEKPIDIRSVRKVLILRYDRIGDIIVTTPIFRALKSLNPDLVLGVLASPSNAEIIRHDSSVDKLHVLHSNWFRLFHMIVDARRERYDVVLNFIFNRTTSGGVLSNLIAPQGIKVGQGAEKYRFYFNRLLDLNRGNQHMVEVFIGYVEEVFGVSLSSTDSAFSIALQDDDRATVTSFVARHKLRSETGRVASRGFVLLNLSATDEVRRISGNQAEEITRILSGRLGLPVVVISSPEDNAWKREVVRRATSGEVYAFPEEGTATLREISSLIGEALFVVTPDTSIIHFASAMKTPVLGLFTPLQVTVEWLPWRVKHAAVLADPGKPVESIPLAQIERGLVAFANQVMSE